MRDPRNWVRPAAASWWAPPPGAALVVVRVRRNSRRRAAHSRGPVDHARRTAREVATEARRLLDRR